MVFPIKPPCIGDLQLPCLIMKGSYNMIFTTAARFQVGSICGINVGHGENKAAFRSLLKSIPSLQHSGPYNQWILPVTVLPKQTD